MGNEYAKTEQVKEAEQQIKQVYNVFDEDCEKKEATAALAARALENTAGDGYAHIWSENALREFKSSVELLSGGTNTVLVDDRGIPSVMVRVPLLTNRDLLRKGSDTVHPAFMLRGEPQKALYISKFQNILIDGRGYSLPLKDPAYGVPFEQALEACRAKGDGWHLSSFALRAALVLWMRQNGFLPHGNSDDGCDFLHREERGMPTLDGRVATGSGPVTWAHNHSRDGIFDLTGNLNEWFAGLRLMNGEIQIIPGCDCALPECDMSQDSHDWRAVLPDGTLADPGSQDTLKFDYRDGAIRLTTRIGECTGEPHDCSFKDVRAEEGLCLPELIYSLILCPEDSDGLYDGWRWIKTEGECLPLCGGAHRVQNHAGVYFLGMTYPRTKNYELAGFRSACILKD
ncbi:MAG TPA: hypothetical protein VHT96_12700 [Clostridia bacterium]|nr:hypothetical protein [Clostridia bacterium]